MGESSSSASLTVAAFDADSFRGLFGEPADPGEAEAALPKNDLEWRTDISLEFHKYNVMLL